MPRSAKANTQKVQLPTQLGRISDARENACPSDPNSDRFGPLSITGYSSPGLFPDITMFACVAGEPSSENELAPLSITQM